MNETQKSRPPAAQTEAMENIYRRLFNHNVVLSAVANLEGYFLELNPAWSRVLGYDVEELKSVPFLHFVHPEDRAKTESEAVKLASAPIVSIDFENRYRCKDGSYRWLAWYAVAVAEEQLIYATALDITEQKHSREKSDRQARTLNLTGKMAKVGGWELDLETQSPRWSDEVYRIHELPLDTEPSLVDAISFYAPEVRDEVGECVKTTLEGGPSWDREWPFITARGRPIWVRAQGEAVHGETGTIIGLRGTFQDITLRKKAELELERGESVLRALHGITAEVSLSFEQRLEKLLALGLDTWGLNLAIVSEIRDQDYFVRHSLGRDFDAPPRGTRLMASETYCIHVLNASSPQAFHEAGASRIAEHPCYKMFGLEAYIGTPLFVDGRRYGTLNFSAPDSREAFSQRDLETAKLFAQWVGNEMTQHAARERLAKATDEAVAASEAKSTFLAMMSHEIRTPMNGVLGNTQLLLDTPLNDEQLEFVQTIRSSGEGLLTIINDLLDFSKVEAGKLELTEEVFDIESTLVDVVDLFSGPATQKGVELVLDLHGPLPRSVRGDSGRIRQITLNFVSNALKFTETGHVLVRVDAEAGENETSKLSIAISDTGPGISAEGLEKLFLPFEQVDNGSARRFGGTGLGLAISRRLAQLMGGRVGATSTLGEGSRFWLELQLPADWSVQPSSPQEFDAILVDSVAPSREAVTRQLELTGFEVEAHQSAVGNDWAERLGTPPELLIVATRTTGKNAAREYAACEELIDRALASELPVLVLQQNVSKSAYAPMGPDAMVRSLTLPVRPSALQKACQVLLRLAGKTDSLFPKSSRASLVPPGGGIERSSTFQSLPPRQEAKVLVVEDNSVNQKVARRMLEKLGCVVDMATNGHEAVDLTGRFQYDFVFMDCHMPEMDGYEATRAIRSRELVTQCERVHIIALTANAMGKDRELCRDAGMDDFISKPVKIEELSRALRPDPSN